MKPEESPSVWRIRHADAGRSYSGDLASEAAIVIVANGTLLVTLKECKQVVGPEEIFLIPPGQEVECKVQKEAQVILCYFVPEIIPGILSLQEQMYFCRNMKRESAGPELTILEINKACQAFLDLFRYYYHEGITSSRMQTLKLQEFFFLLSHTYDKEKVAAFLQPVINGRSDFRNFVHANWKNARNVGELAAMANLSTSGFMKKFRRCFSESAYKWMTQRKAESVLEEITSGQIPFKEIVDKYHFASYAHFGTFCKAQYGDSPKAIQRRGKEGFLQLKFSKPVTESVI